MTAGKRPSEETMQNLVEAMKAFEEEAGAKYVAVPLIYLRALVDWLVELKGEGVEDIMRSFEETTGEKYLN